MHTLQNDILKYILAIILSIICSLAVVRFFFFPEDGSFNIMQALTHSKEMCMTVIVIFISFFTISILITTASITQGKLRKEREMLRVFRKKDEIKTKFLAFAAHNLRTPATALRWSLNDFLKNEYGHLTKEQQTSIQDLYSVSLTMLNIIEDFLDISKLELQKFEISLKAVPLRDLKQSLQNVLEEFSPIIKEKKIHTSQTFSIDEEALIHIDLSQIKRVMENLIENAAHYTLEQGNIDVSIKNDKEFVSVSIKDSGIGIPRVEHPMIFGEFFRSSNAKKHKSTGSGIGLYMARKLVEAHSGTISFISDEGRGSTFTFKIPMIPEGQREVADVFKRI